jgi:hypothetical protein
MSQQALTCKCVRQWTKFAAVSVNHDNCQRAENCSRDYKQINKENRTNQPTSQQTNKYTFISYKLFYGTFPVI